jgi:hypothetical protein
MVALQCFETPATYLSVGTAWGPERFEFSVRCARLGVHTVLLTEIKSFWGYAGLSVGVVIDAVEAFAVFFFRICAVQKSRYSQYSFYLVSQSHNYKL